jgi:thioredoxin 1
MIVTNDNFEETLKNNSIVLIDFWAEWCGPCKRMEPILQEFESEIGIPVGKLNVDEYPEKSQEYSVQSIPTMVLFKDGNPVHTITGAMPKHKLVQELAQWI